MPNRLTRNTAGPSSPRVGKAATDTIITDWAANIARRAPPIQQQPPEYPPAGIACRQYADRHGYRCPRESPLNRERLRVAHDHQERERTGGHAGPETPESTIANQRPAAEPSPVRVLWLPREPHEQQTGQQHHQSVRRGHQAKHLTRLPAAAHQRLGDCRKQDRPPRTPSPSSR
jgi:hypothetical protein